MEARCGAVTGYAFDLAYATPPEWARAAAADPLGLLSDHAHCELQAAVACKALIARYPDRSALVDLAAAVVSEEMEHFRQVLALLRELGGELRDGGPNPYVDGLRRAAGKSKQYALLDRLLFAALIERRSCERFELLAETDAEPRLVELYARLAPEEIEHQRLFLDAARHEAAADGLPEGAVDERLAHLVELEGALVPRLDFGPRMHSGPPAGVPAG